MKKHILSFLLLFVVATLLCRAQNPILWGMTWFGGNNNAGLIFNYNASTSTETILHDFPSSDTDGQYPQVSFIQASNGLLYGMTTNGGIYGTNLSNGGVIFSYNISNNSYIPLYDFGNDSDGTQPLGSLMQASNGLLYGTTYNGGADYDGTIFSYDILTGKETDIHDFPSSDTDGIHPSSTLIQVNDSMLYGLTENGGRFGGGIIFSYNILTGSAAILHSFGNGSDEDQAVGSLILSNNNLLYGMTWFGGANGDGTIFSYNISTGKETVLHSFGGGTDGSIPSFSGSFIQVDSLLYAMTTEGGTNDSGTIFSYNISTEQETVLHSFGNDNDGANPTGSIIHSSNRLLYGMTQVGGTNDSGTIFSYNISTDTETVIYNFTGTDGYRPSGSLLEVDTPITGINQLSSNNNQLSIYPNPTSGQLTIKLDGNQNGYMADVYNVMGEEVYESVLSNSLNTINLGLQSAGMYFVYLKSEVGWKWGRWWWRNKKLV